MAPSARKSATRASTETKRSEWLIVDKPLAEMSDSRRQMMTLNAAMRLKLATSASNLVGDSRTKQAEVGQELIKHQFEHFTSASDSKWATLNAAANVARAKRRFSLQTVDGEDVSNLSTTKGKGAGTAAVHPEHPDGQ